MSALDAFFLDIPPQCCSFVPSNRVRPSGAGDFAHNTTKMRGGASASGGQCVWMRINSHHSNNTHAPFTLPGQAGGASVSPLSTERRKKVPAAHLTPKLPEPLIQINTQWISAMIDGWQEMPFFFFLLLQCDRLLQIRTAVFAEADKCSQVLLFVLFRLRRLAVQPVKVQ